MAAEGKTKYEFIVSRQVQFVIIVDSGREAEPAWCAAPGEWGVTPPLASPAAQLEALLGALESRAVLKSSIKDMGQQTESLQAMIETIKLETEKSTEGKTSNPVQGNIDEGVQKSEAGACEMHARDTAETCERQAGTSSTQECVNSCQRQRPAAVNKGQRQPEGTVSTNQVQEPAGEASSTKDLDTANCGKESTAMSEQGAESGESAISPRQRTALASMQAAYYAGEQVKETLVVIGLESIEHEIRDEEDLVSLHRQLLQLWSQTSGQENHGNVGEYLGKHEKADVKKKDSTQLRD